MSYEALDSQAQKQLEGVAYSEACEAYVGAHFDDYLSRMQAAVSEAEKHGKDIAAIATPIPDIADHPVDSGGRILIFNKLKAHYQEAYPGKILTSTYLREYEGMRVEDEDPTAFALQVIRLCEPEKLRQAGGKAVAGDVRIGLVE